MTIDVPERFIDFVSDWNYPEYLLIGGYGSGKSYSTALKLILLCLSEVRRVLVVRQVMDTIRDSCFSLFREILLGMEDVAEGTILRTAPMAIFFDNGSEIIFKGLDKPSKLRSINGVSVVWVEEASEISFDAYKELKGRLRHPTLSNHMFLTCNPISRSSWIYRHFFNQLVNGEMETNKMDEERFYTESPLVANMVYYLHSKADDNPFLPQSYIKTLDDLASYDPYLYSVARLGRFGVEGLRVLPQIELGKTEEVEEIIAKIPRQFHFIGMDFGFEESYNAVVEMAVDDKEKVLYVYGELYINHVTDDKMASLPEMQALMKRQIIADSAEPKTIQYYRQQGYQMRGCHKWVGSRLANVRKIKRFKRIVVSGACPNTWRELSTLVFQKARNGDIIYDEFNIDPHTLSAIWYALDNYNVADVKVRNFSSREG